METGLRRLGHHLLGAFEEVVAIVTSPFRRVRRWRVERHLARRMRVFDTLGAYSSEETEQLRPLLIEHERALSRVDFWQELCVLPTRLPYLLFVYFGWIVIRQAFNDAADYGAGAHTLVVPVLAYFVGIAIVWRTVRRVLPPLKFAVVGSRQYQQRPWRLIGSILLVFAMGVGAYHISGWGLQIDSDWYYLVLYAGAGLFNGCVLAALWVVLRLLSTIGEWLLEHAETFSHPEAVVVDNYLAMLAELHTLEVNDKRLAGSPASKRTLIDLLELSARCTEEGLRRDLKGLDPGTDEWVRKGTAEMATAMRVLKKEVISGEQETEAKLVDRFRNDLRRAILGGWTQLPRVAELVYQGESSGSFLLRIVVSIVLVALPLAFVLPSALRSDKSDQAAEAADLAESPAPPAGTGGGSREATRTLRDNARDWDANLQLIAGILASIVLLMSRFDDLATRFSRQRSQPRAPAAEGG